ncbi:MAG: methyltransferase domain-containing protein [Acidimicrobiia bacterium]|nr:methyltransferase domain-containing protein [Acidimicrobiia bacterium]
MSELDSYYRDHWAEIEPERFDRYDRMFRLDPRLAARQLAPVDVQPGETVLDFGCGPGYVAVELARIGGAGTKVHGVDLNADFVARARQVAAEAGFGEQVTIHHSTDERIPLGDATVDRAYCKNVLEYVPDPAATLAEIARVLRPGGTLVVSDSDFGFVVIEPLGPAEVAELFDAAAPAFKDPNIGRHLPALLRGAGLVEVRTKVLTAIDEAGYLRGVVENMLGYALRFERMSAERADEIRATIETGLATSTYLAALPQWWVSGTKPAPSPT